MTGKLSPQFTDEVDRVRRAAIRARLHAGVDRVVDAFEAATATLTLDELVELDRLLSKTLAGDGETM